ncbi:hypothetical protein RHGRI_020858 [Rhododendron griersonianum]|uniref:Uncharacterized protein n=1 Tax=Rhododendron griersonianum TaxID=479676 RepID=A0AAV6JNV1_9ERIC|nr:hypothetical protein RHGRI_020858 [Rhododendron griersonianum]
MRHRRVPSVRRFGFGKPRYEGSTEGFRRFVGSASGNRGTKEARKGSVDSWVWFKKTKARMRHGRVLSVRLWETEVRKKHGRVPSFRRFGFGKPRYEGSTEGFRRFMGLV